MWIWVTGHPEFFGLLCVNLIALLNGVLPYLPAGRAKTAVGKFASWLRWLLDLLAPTSAKDSPGSVKVPLTWSKPPEICAPPRDATQPMGSQPPAGAQP